MSTGTVVERPQYRNVIGFDRAHMTMYHWLIAALAATSGVVHLYLFATTEWVMFLAAGLGFFAAIGAMLLVRYGHVLRRAIYALTIAFTAGQIGGWYVMDGTITTLALIDKPVQVALIALLVYLIWKETSDPTVG